jgi:hypothetical protein
VFVLQSSLKTLQRATGFIDVYQGQLELKLFRPRVGGVYNRTTILHVTTTTNLHASYPLNQKVSEVERPKGRGAVGGLLNGRRMAEYHYKLL